MICIFANQVYLSECQSDDESTEIKFTISLQTYIGKKRRNKLEQEKLW